MNLSGHFIPAVGKMPHSKKSIYCIAQTIFTLTIVICVRKNIATHGTLVNVQYRRRANIC